MSFFLTILINLPSLTVTSQIGELAIFFLFSTIIIFLSPIQPYPKLGVLLLDVFFASPGTAVVGLLRTSAVDDRSGVAE